MKFLHYSYAFLLICMGALIPQSCASGKVTGNDVSDETFDINIGDMRARDPFILVDREDKSYYLHVSSNKRVKVYKSKDLTMWKDLGFAFDPDSDFWGKQDFWAPDTYYYDGKYYMFITLSAPGIKRGTSILVSEKPEGPFAPLVNKAATPPNWMSLDGALYVDNDNTPWMLYCHEWVEVGDGEVVAQKLKKDLTETVGEPIVLFRASEAPWVHEIGGEGTRGKVTDAPFIYTTDSGKMLMLWSSFKKDGKYAIGQAYSSSGTVLGPWIQLPEPLNDDDGGHAMLFYDLEGILRISYHSPNSKTEKPNIREAKVMNGKIYIN